MSEPKDDPIPHEAQVVLSLFAQELREVRFPDLDHQVLAASAQELREAQLEVECIEAALEQARALVRERSQALSQKAQRAMSYARIFAAEDPALSARIAEIDRASRSAPLLSQPAKKRGRPRRSTQDVELFADESKESDEEAAA